MVNLGQKGWKQFHLFYFQIKLVQYKKAEKSPYFSAFSFNIVKIYSAALKRFATSSQLITLKNASI
jgi:hypothetical protein